METKQENLLDYSRLLTALLVGRANASPIRLIDATVAWPRSPSPSSVAVLPDNADAVLEFPGTGS